MNYLLMLNTFCAYTLLNFFNLEIAHNLSTKSYANLFQFNKLMQMILRVCI